MRQGMNIRVGQSVTMTAQLAHSIRLLQLSSLELAEELQTALDENPMLEVVEELPADEAPEAGDVVADAQGDAFGDEGLWGAGGVADDDRQPDYAMPEDGDVHARILAQIQFVFTEERELRIALALADAVDDAGYLAQPLDEIRQALSADMNVTSAQLEAVLRRIQRLEPAGYGARDLGECLSVQLQELPADEPYRDLALALVASSLDDIARMRWAQLARLTKVDEDAILHAVNLIRRMNPKPAALDSQVQYITPDVRVVRAEGGWLVRLNRGAVPQLRVNAEYERIVSDSDATTLKAHLQEARWLVRSVQQRDDTLLRAAQVIFERQAGFLERGELGLKPLTLREVAEAVGVHESTISRITTSKYVQTPRGVFSLKLFFPSQLTTAEGVDASGASVKAMIQKLVRRESAGEPLRDVDIAAILARRGVRVARRTVAKYREALGIASSKERLQRYQLAAVMGR